MVNETFCQGIDSAMGGSGRRGKRKTVVAVLSGIDSHGQRYSVHAKPLGSKKHPASMGKANEGLLILVLNSGSSSVKYDICAA